MYKWVQDSPGSYKLVDKSDPRPEVKLKSHAGKGSIHTPFTPSWKRYEEGMWNQENKDQGETADRFVEEREHAIKTDARAKSWEEGRKAELARQKPYWRREMIRKGVIEVP